MKALEVSDLKTLENYWKDYHYHKREIALLEKAYSKKELSQDKRYEKLVEIVGAVDKVFASLDQDKKEFANLRYLNEEAPFFDWADISDELNISKSKAYKLRVFILTKTAEAIGYVARPIRV